MKILPGKPKKSAGITIACVLDYPPGDATFAIEWCRNGGNLIKTDWIKGTERVSKLKRGYTNKPKDNDFQVGDTVNVKTCFSL